MQPGYSSNCEQLPLTSSPEVTSKRNGFANGRTRHTDYFRPDTNLLRAPDDVKHCMHNCWQESPEDRPDFKTVYGQLKKLRAGL